MKCIKKILKSFVSSLIIHLRDWERLKSQTPTSTLNSSKMFRISSFFFFFFQAFIPHIPGSQRLYMYRVLIHLPIHPWVLCWKVCSPHSTPVMGSLSVFLTLWPFSFSSSSLSFVAVASCWLDIVSTIHKWRVKSWPQIGKGPHFQLWFYGKKHAHILVQPLVSADLRKD